MFTFLGSVVVIGGCLFFWVWWFFFWKINNHLPSDGCRFTIGVLLGFVSITTGLIAGMFLAVMVGKSLPVYQEKIGVEECGEYVIETYATAFKNRKHNLIGLPPQGITKIVVPKPSKKRE